ncbi:hypothetical protein [Flavobacterium sp. XGLA_31]|uniref:hypothetical protein n=1 Tax=Flavobacterium sp. XGLA_31 TaxID=3447666 RepID=UPI003F4085FD
MNQTLKNILAVIIGLLIGGALNMAIIMVSGKIIPPPEGADLTTMEGLKAAMALMEPKHFLMPFLAHALGTLLGAFIAAVISKKTGPALAVGFFFLIGGIMNVVMLPSPLWFTIVDVVGAYIPMAYLGGVIALRKK